MNNNQQEILEYLQSVLPEHTVIQNDTSIGYELTFCVPSKNFAFQYNDLLLNSSKFVSKRTLNKDKAIACRANGLTLLSIFSDEWDSKKDLIKAMIRHRLGISTGIKIGARELEVRYLQKNAEFKDFFNKFHLDSHTNGKWAIGLFHENELVACASMRTNHAGENEIARLAINYNFSIPGAAGKLISEIKKRITGDLISYSNNRLSEGGIYKKLGFVHLAENQPSYFYTDGKKRTWRFACKRINDPEILAKYPEVPHTENDQALGGVFSMKIYGDRRPLYKIYDNGHTKWKAV